ncbi:uncharacterized protein LOC107502318 isoform X3 [Rousettus aegyptiacus]|uniref:uncharacterized protein LOC107502318 isoform X3 n=1 Tax=Rousettus aegyptiacus TaxID=9407 RepID=UPI00168CB178|nr:uncharacterized protein LOC107502318 isoform X3 [Rousettus aegyptiacus]
MKKEVFLFLDKYSEVKLLSQKFTNLQRPRIFSQAPEDELQAAAPKHILHRLEDVQRQLHSVLHLKSFKVLCVGIKESLPKAPERSVCLYGMVMTETSPERILGEIQLLKPNEWN